MKDDNLKPGFDDQIKWTGDLKNDCLAQWKGLMLRAEKLESKIWWWAVYDMEKEDRTVDSSHEYDVRFTSGHKARMAAEQAARIYLGLN